MTANAPAGGTWGRVADRGQFDLIILTRKAALDNFIVLHPGAAFMGILSTDFGTHVPLQYLDTEGLLAFVENMAPREVELYRGRDESVTELLAHIQKIIDIQKSNATELAEVTVARAARR